MSRLSCWFFDILVSFNKLLGGKLCLDRPVYEFLQIRRKNLNAGGIHSRR
jgi:hypothetical protein